MSFFTLKKDALLTLQTWLLEAYKIVGAAGAPSPPVEADLQQQLFPVVPAVPKQPEQKSAYLAARKSLEEIKVRQMGEDQEFVFVDEDVVRLSAWPLEWRFVFYVVLRAELRFQGDYNRSNPIKPEDAFQESLKKITDQIRKFVEIYDSVQDGSRNIYNSIVVRGAYSEELVPNLVIEGDSMFHDDLSLEVVERDALDIAPESLDAIICDPPYGFNTTEQQGDLAKALASLRDGGHLVICLPAESRTGRELPYCTKSGLVINQVLVKARALGRQVYAPARSLPSSIFTPPYYWESERALTRQILHFRVFGKAAQQTVPADGPASRARG